MGARTQGRPFHVRDPYTRAPLSWNGNLARGRPLSPLSYKGALTHGRPFHVRVPLHQEAPFIQGRPSTRNPLSYKGALTPEGPGTAISGFYGFSGFGVRAYTAT